MDPNGVDNQMISDLAVINDVSASEARKLGEAVLQFLIDSKGSEFQENLGQLAQTSKLSAPSLKAAVRGLIIFFQDAMKEASAVQVVKERLSNCGVSSSQSASLADVWAENLARVSSSLLSRLVSANQLVDVDWSFGVTASSDDCDRVGRTYLQLKLVIDEGNINLRQVYMELSLEQFYHFMAQMEKAKAYMDYASGVNE